MSEVSEKIDTGIKKVGGRRPGSGRKKGSRNKVTADVKALAQKYAPAALKELARLSLKAESEQARAAACKEILDRAYGKSVQPVEGDDRQPIIIQVISYGEQPAEVSVNGHSNGNGAHVR